GERDLPRYLWANPVHCDRRDIVHVAAWLPRSLSAGHIAAEDQQPADDHGAAAILDIAPGAHHGLGGASAATWRDQRCSAVIPSDQPAARADLQPVRHGAGNDAYSASVHPAADLQRDEDDLAESRTRCALPWRWAVLCLLAHIFPADVA